MNPLMTLWLGTRATVFWIGFTASTIFYGAITPLLLFLPFNVRYPLVRPYSQVNVWWLKVCCGVKYQVIGKENIPKDEAIVIMANHQSTWETISLASIFPPLTWVLKRELLRIPFFGWGLSLIRPIAIDRKVGKTAIEQIKIQGKERLDRGLSLVIFPEGTRVTKGKVIPFKKGGAVLAEYAQKNVLPVAHNAIECWPRHSFIKLPGTITVSVGELINTQGMTVDEIIGQVKTWVNEEKLKLPPSR